MPDDIEVMKYIAKRHDFKWLPFVAKAILLLYKRQEEILLKLDKLGK